jgi:restriction endonuclease S subunit
MILEFTTDFKNIGKQESLRPNFGYRYFFDIQGAKIFSAKNYVRLKDVLKSIISKKITKGELEEPEILVDIGNIERRFNNLINLQEVNEIDSDKNILQEGDIVIPKLQPQMGNIFLNLEHRRYIASTELLEYKITSENNPHFIYYLFTTKEFLFNLSKLESGKTHRRVNPKDLLKIKIPEVPKFIQDRLVAEIEPIEKQIKELKNVVKEREREKN